MQEHAETVASIDDLLFQILLRLPIKSLIRFKSVSKHWHSLITDPRFSRRRNPNPNPPVGLFFRHKDSLPYEYISFSGSHKGPTIKSPVDPISFSILHSCNGLLLCCTSVKPDSDDFLLFVCNPTTGRVSVLPELRNPFPVGRTLAYDPNKSHHYNVVCVVRQFQNSCLKSRYEIHVYSSESGVWRLWGDNIRKAPLLSFHRGVYWNGSVHWMSTLIAVKSWRFDVERQVLDEMPNPPSRGGDGCFRCSFYLGESCDHLHYVEMDAPRTRFDVYELKRDYSGWFVKFRLDLSPVFDSYPGMVMDRVWNRYFDVLAVVRCEKEAEDCFVVLQIPGKIIKLNLVEGTVEPLREFEVEVVGDDSMSVRSWNKMQYIESLSCV